MPHPHILFVCYEDTTPRFGAYGDPLARTPVFDRLASEGCRFDQCFGNSPICAPSRSSVFTGMYPTAIHCQNMRTTHTNTVLPEMATPYVAVPPPYAKCFTEYLRAAGYFCTAQGKADFQFMPKIQDFPLTAFDLVAPPMRTNTEDGSEGEIPEPLWRRRPDGAPFFAFYNLDATHESGMWPRADRLTPRTDPRAVVVPPYFPDTPAIRATIARQYDNLEKNDRELGRLIAGLEEDGLLDETIVLLWADHGEGLPRSKRMLYSRGLHLPLVIRHPRLIPTGSNEPGIVSNIDLAPTLFSLAGLEVPAHFHGQIVAGPHATRPAYSYACRDRMGEGNGRLRSVRDHQYTYIQNSFPWQEAYPWEQYRNVHPAMQDLYRLHAAGELNAQQEEIFFSLPPSEELYDRTTDPWETNNLARLPEHKERLTAFRVLQREFERDFEPFRDLSEEQLRMFQTVQERAPMTTAPRPIILGPGTNGRQPIQSGESVPGPALLQLACPTHGASQAYQLEPLDAAALPGPGWAPDTGPIDVSICWPANPYADASRPWRLYHMPIRLAPGTYLLRTRALRYGYVESPINQYLFAITEPPKVASPK